MCAGLDPRSLILSVRSFNSADSFPSPDRTGLNSSTSLSANELLLAGGEGLMESPTQESTPLLLSPDAIPQGAPLTRFMGSETDSSSGGAVGSEEYSVDLPTFLIQRACANSALVNYFYW